MVAVKPPPYPEALTTKFWDKAKGIIARVTKVKTGITEELKKARDAYDNAPWGDLDTNVALPKLQKGKSQKTLTPKDVDALLYAYLEQNQPAFKKLEAVYSDLSTFLKKKAGEFASDDKTKSFAKPVLAMADAANKFTYAVAWGTVSSSNQAVFAKMKAESIKIEKQWQDARKDLATNIGKAEDAVKKAKGKKTTVKEYNNMWSQYLRGIGAQIAMAGLKDDFSGELGNIKKAWNDKNLPKKDEEVAEQLKKDEEYVAAFKKRLAELSGN